MLGHKKSAPPGKAGAAGPGKRKIAPPEQAGKTLRVLLVEDDVQIVKMVRTVLPRSVARENIGVSIKDVPSADGVPGLLEDAGDGVPFDLILLDLLDGTCGEDGRRRANGVLLIKELMEAGRQDVLDRIVAFSGTAGELTGDRMEAIGGRLIDKSETEAFRGIVKFACEGILTSWNPPRPTWEPGPPGA